MHTPPAPKLSLQDRRSLSDDWDPKRPEYEKQLTALLGVDWKCEVDPLSIVPYAGEHAGNMGKVFASYFEDAIRSLKGYFLREYGDAGKKELNSIASAHTLGLAFDPDGTYTYCGPIIKDGALVMVFSEGKLWYNSGGALDIKKLIRALEAVPRADADALPVSATLNIATSYDPKIEEVRSNIANQAGNPAIKLNPNWTQVYRALKGEEDRGTKLRDDWKATFGSATLSYFDGAASWLKWRKLFEDELLLEAFNEAVHSNEIALRIVDKLEYGSYAECKIEDGILYIQTTPKGWYSNVGNTLEKIVDRLNEAV